MTDHYQNVQEIEAVVAGFENCTTPKDGFTHLSHLTVATFYLYTSTPQLAFEKMRFGLFRFLNHHGVDLSKYDERVTRAWLKEVQNVIEHSDPDSSLVSLTNIVLTRLGTFRLPVEANDEVDPK
jgi:hypothetical protein